MQLEKRLIVSDSAMALVWHAIDDRGEIRAVIQNARGSAKTPDREPIWRFDIMGREKPTALKRVYYHTVDEALDAVRAGLGC
jgi:hypothetical protein